MVKVELTPEEWAEATNVGANRFALYQENQRVGPGTTLEGNEMGAIAEYALAKHFGSDVLEDWKRTKAFSQKYWDIKSDVGKNVQIRATKHRHGVLIIYKWERGDRPFVLAIVRPDSLVVSFPGWRTADELHALGTVQTQLPRRNVGMTQEDLRPLDTLPQEYVR